MKITACYKKYFIIFLLFANIGLFAQKQLTTQVLVIGGGTSGSAAGLQAARMGVQTIIAEPTVWLGGMFSAAGVPAFDGNHNMPTGIWAEFREQLYRVYGGPNKVATGWVSNTQFEPRVGDSILKSFASREKNLKVLYQCQFLRVLITGKTITGAVFYNEKDKTTITINAKQVIDATELGDVIASAKMPFDVGMEANSLTGENVNVPASNNIIQDITYAAILKDFGPAADKTLAKPANYDPMEFDGCCNEFSSTPAKLTSNVSAKKMLDYGKLPNGKYMINWPGKGNDIYLNIINLTPSQRVEELKKAKAKTLRFIYFLQTQFGFKHLGLADDEFPTTDQLPLMPYHRESRRVKGLVRFKVQHISDPFNENSPLYRTGIAVGDYPIDHHHRENLDAPQHLGFYPIPSFNIPLGSLIPNDGFSGIMVAEKSISVSNVVNGTTRLQPSVMAIGQAAGTLAARCIIDKKNAPQINVRNLQLDLLRSNAYIMPYYDVKPTSIFFNSIQKIGATGIIKGVGQPNAWANRTWFYPDSLITNKDFANGFNSFGKVTISNNEMLTIATAIATIIQTNSKYLQPSYPKNIIDFTNQLKKEWKENWGLENFEPTRPITRLELAVLLNHTINPFQIKQVNHQGNFIN